MRLTRFITLICIAICLILKASGQTFIGNYFGANTINQVNDNPAFALTQDRAQINLFSAAVSAGGNYLLFKGHAYSFLTDGLIEPGTDYIKNPATASRQMYLNMEILGPSAAFVIKKRYSFAITTAMRYFVNSKNLDNNVFMSLGAGATPDSAANNHYNINNYSFTTNIFKELNISYADFVHNAEDYSLVAGGTLKILQGVGAAGLNIPQASYTTSNDDGKAYNLNARASVAFTPYANKFALFNSPLNATQATANNFSAGLNLGLVYYIHINNSFTNKQNYQARFGLSITDIGSINYTASSTSGQYAANGQTINYRALQNNPQQTFGNQVFNNFLMDSVAKPTGNIASFKVHLPTALRFNADVNVIQERFYLNVNGVVNLINPSSDKFANYYITTFTITPRYLFDTYDEIGLAVPFSYNVINQGGMGLVAFAGPFFVGSGSFFNMFVTNTFKSVNLYTGLSLRIKPKKPKEKDYMMM